MSKNRDLGNYKEGALSPVQSSPTDTTVGALMAVGAFGLGKQTISSEVDANNYTTPGTYISVSGGHVNFPPAGVDWVEIFNTGNILGTVSQSAGVPTGAVIERGSNANGEYVKYADGTLECWHVIDAAGNNAQDQGQVTWATPVFFTGQASGSVVAAVSGGTTIQVDSYRSGKMGANTLTAHFIFTAAVSSSNTVNYSFRASGRWY